jgi:hypothetical protein
MFLNSVPENNNNKEYVGNNIKLKTSKKERQNSYQIAVWFSNNDRKNLKAFCFSFPWTPC